ncbi:MAG: type II secretion system minor pseudopilin GspK, partial [Planctomycetota bacterium]
MTVRSKQHGIVLLLVLMVLAILIVVVGQFATTAVLDWKIAKNRELEAQLTLDVRAGVEAAVE